MKIGGSSPLSETPAPAAGRETRQTVNPTSAAQWQAVPGYEARRFKVGARVLEAAKALPWWAKVAPAVAVMVLVATLCAGRVAGNPASQGGFSDTETATMSFQAGTWGCGGGHGGCGVGESVYGQQPEGCGGNGGCREGDPGHQSNGGGPGGDGGGNAAGEGGGSGSAAGNAGSIYDGAAENAALATGTTDTPGDTGGAGTGDSAGSGGNADSGGSDGGSGAGGSDAGGGSEHGNAGSGSKSSEADHQEKP